ncbi:hypothetical protein PHMEG_0004750 [Phytophthora megakarya]|uniref:Uncharacterized protein n=1 Tax=Phytophthora megakarya TaxID=4795 RepID=A0A225WSX8_9STRA|nr:hypothetical protein PHMEG_0004750 [Phytophthora megakarya]
MGLAAGLLIIEKGYERITGSTLRDFEGCTAGRNFLLSLSKQEEVIGATSGEFPFELDLAMINRCGMNQESRSDKLIAYVPPGQHLLTDAGYKL